MVEFFINTWETLIKYRVIFLEGTKNTLLLSLFAVLLGIIFGTVIALMRMSSFKPVKWIALAYIEFIRGTPLMVQLFVIFYGLPALGVKFPEVPFIENFPRFAAGIFAMSINSGAYVAEIIRSGVQAVDFGQMEAARSIGMKKGAAMRYVVLPQAVRNILPALGNEFVVVVKESSIVSVIGISELMFRSGDVRSITFKVFEPYFIVAVIYFIITFTLSKLLGVAERRMRKSVER